MRACDAACCRAQADDENFLGFVSSVPRHRTLGELAMAQCGSITFIARPLYKLWDGIFGSYAVAHVGTLTSRLAFWTTIGARCGCAPVALCAAAARATHAPATRSRGGGLAAQWLACAYYFGFLYCHACRVFVCTMRVFLLPPHRPLPAHNNE